jgi:hypothetical protein
MPEESEPCTGLREKTAYIGASGEVICYNNNCSYHKFIPAMNLESYHKCTKQEVRNIIIERDRKEAMERKKAEREERDKRERTRRLERYEREQKEGIKRDLSVKL